MGGEASCFAFYILTFEFKKNADDGNRRPVLTSETTKRKTLENRKLKLLIWKRGS
jgi:hypothetical protein